MAGSILYDKNSDACTARGTFFAFRKRVAAGEVPCYDKKLDANRVPGIEGALGTHDFIDRRAGEPVLFSR